MEAVLLVLLLSLQGATCDTCAAFLSFAQPPGSLDAFQGPLFANFSWLPGTCRAGSSVAFDSGWVEEAGAVVPLPTGENAAVPTVSKVSVRRAAFASFSGSELVHANVTLEFRLQLSGQLHGVSVAGQALTGLVVQTLAKAVPTTIVAALPPAWRGSVSSEGAQLSLRDLDLFDGVPYAAMKKQALDGELDDLMAAGGVVSRIVGEVAMRIDALESHVAGAASSVLGSFPGGEHLIAGDTLSGVLAGFEADGAGVLMSFTRECTSDCGLLSAAISDVVAGSGASAACASALDASMVSSSLTVDVFVSTSAVVVWAVSARTSALFMCGHGGAEGAVGMRLAAVSPHGPSSWPLVALITDPKVALGLTKRSLMHLDGSLHGRIGATSATGLSLFGAFQGGILQPDSSVTLSSGDALFSSCRDLLPTVGVPSVDAALHALFSKTMVEEYLASSPDPTYLGLLSRLEAVSLGVVSVRPSPKNVTVIVTLHVDGESGNADYPLAVEAVQHAVQSLGGALTSAYPDAMQPYDLPNVTADALRAAKATDTVDAVVHAEFVMSLMSGTPTVKEGPASHSARVSVAVPSFPSSKAAFKTVHASFALGVTGEPSAPQYGPGSLRACVASGIATALPGGECDVLLDGSSALSFNVAWAGKVADDLTTAVGSMMAEIGATAWARHLSPVSVHAGTIGGHPSGVTFASFVSSIPSLLAGLGSGARARDIENKIIAGLTDAVAGEPVVANFAVVVDASNAAVHLSLDVASLYMVSIGSEGSAWSNIAATGRLQLPLLLRSSVEMDAPANADGVLKKFSCDGSTSVAGFSLPTAHLMRGGVASGLAKLAMHFPPGGEASAWSIACDVAASLGKGFATHLGDASFGSSSGPDGGAPLPPTLHIIENEVDALVMDAGAALVAISDVASALGSAFGGELALVLPGLMDRLELGEQYLEDVEHVLAWLQSPQSSTGGLTRSTPVCVSSLPATTLNLTVNQQINYPACKIAFGGEATLAAAAATLSKGLVDCGAGQFVVATAQRDESGEECGSFVLIPAADGAVYDLGVNPSSTGLAFQAHYAQAFVPSFVTWDSVAPLLQKLLPADVARLLKPVIGSISTKTLATNGVFEEALVALYPPTLPTVSLQFKHAYNESLTFNFTSSAVATKGGALALSATGAELTGKLNASLSTSFSAVLGGPPIGGGQNLSISTSLEQSDDVVPPAPENSFTLSVVAQRRSPGGTAVPVQEAHTITLTPGKTMHDALATEVLTQLPEALRPLFTVTLASSPFSSVTQVLITASRVSVGNDVLMPLSVMTSASRIPSIANATLAVQTGRGVAADLHMHFEASVAGRLSTAEGSIGALGLVAGNVVAGASVTADAEMTLGLASSMAVASAARSTDSRFWKTLEAHVEAASYLNVSTLDVRMGSVTIPVGDDDGKASLSVLAGGSFDLNSDNDRDKMANALTVWQAEWHGSQHLKDLYSSLAHFNSSSPCSWFTTVLDFSAELAESSIGQAPLPFASTTFADLYHDGLGADLEQAQEMACRSDHPPTLALFCDALNGIFGRSICANGTSVANGQLELDLDLLAHKSLSSALTFDSKRLFPKSKIPVGATVSADLTMAATFGLKFKLVAALDPRQGPHLSLAPGSSAFVSASFDARGGVKLLFGPLPLSLANARVTLQGPASGEAIMAVTYTKAKSLEFSVNGSASLGANIPLLDQCELDVTMKSLSGFLTGAPGSVVISDSQCGPNGFPGALEKAIEKTTLFTFLEDPNMFTDGIGSGISSLVHDFFGPGGQLGNLVAPIVDRELSKVLAKALGNMLTPEARNAIIADITAYVDEVIRSHNVSNTRATIDQLGLDVLTGAMCKYLPLKTCPPIPKYAPGATYEWVLPFGGQPVSAVKSFDFALGNHGIASLETENCNADFTVTWAVTATLTLSTSKGLGLSFDHKPVLMADAKLQVDPGCKVEGKLVFFGAEMDLNQCVLDAHLEVTRTEALLETAQPGALVRTQRYRGRMRALPFHISFVVSANLDATADIGFAGAVAEAFAHSSDTIQALPHFEMDMAFSWACGTGSTCVPTFKASNFKLCVGRVLFDMLKGLLGKITHVTKPVSDVVKQLLKPIKATKYIFGRELNTIEMLEVIVKSFSDGHGVFKNVYVVLSDIVKIQDLMDDLDKLAVDQCGVFQFAHDFSIDWNKKDPVPVPDGVVVPSGLQFDKSVTPAQRQSYAKTWSMVDGSWGFKFPLFDFKKAPKVFVDLLVGNYNDPMVEFDVPVMSISASAYWSVLIWPFPQVSLGVGVKATLTLDIGKIVYTWRGPMRCIQSKSASKVLSGLGLPTTHDDGSKRWQISGSVKLWGEIDLGLFLLEASAWVSIELQGMVRVVSPTNAPVVYFDEIAQLVKLNGNNIFGATEKRLVLLGGFGVAIRLCINLLFYKKCWTAWKTEFQITMADVTWPVKHLPPSVMSGSNVALGTLTDSNMVMMYAADGFVGSAEDLLASGTATVRIYSTPGGVTVDGWPAGGNVNGALPPLSGTLVASGGTVGFSGSVPAGAAMSYEVWSTPYEVAVPAGKDVNVVLRQDSYPAGTLFSVTPGGISASSGRGVALTSGQVYGSVSLGGDPLVFASVELNGVPKTTNTDGFQVVLDPTGNVTVGGSSKLYGAPLLLQGGAANVDVALEDLVTVAVDPASITGSTSSSVEALATPSFKTVLPAVVDRISVSGHPELPSTFLLGAVPKGRSVVLRGRSMSNEFQVDDLASIKGDALLLGGVGTTQGINAFTANLSTSPGKPVSARAGAGVLVQLQPTKSVLRFRAIQRKTYALRGALNTRTDFTIMNPANDDLVIVNAVGMGGEIQQRVTGCDGQADVRIHLSGAGLHTVTIGAGGLISDFRCTVRVYGGNDIGETDEVVIEADAEMRSLRWTMRQGTLEVADAEKPGDAWAAVHFSAIERITVKFGSGGSDVDVTDGTAQTESMLVFSSNTTAIPGSLRVQRAISPVFVNGSVGTVTVGVAPGASTVIPPLENIIVPVFISALAHGPHVEVALQGSGKTAPSQRYLIGEYCVTVEPALVFRGNMSAWMCDAVVANGFAAAMCHNPCIGVVYQSPDFSRMGITINTGDAADAFEGNNFRVNLTLSSAGGADSFSLSSVVDAAVDAGTGADHINFTAPLGHMSVMCGDDSDPDAVVVYAPPDEALPSVISNGPNAVLISPVGGGGSVQVRERRSQDVALVRRSGGGGGGVVVIRLPDPGQVTPMEIASNTTYMVEELGSLSTVILDGRKTDKAPAATNVHVIVTLPKCDVPNGVTVYGERGSGITLEIRVPSDKPYEVDVIGPKDKSDDLGIVRVDGLSVYAGGVDHFSLVTPETTAGDTNGGPPVWVRVDGTPSSADMVVHSKALGSSPAVSLTGVTFDNNTLVWGPVAVTVASTALEQVTSNDMYLVVTGSGSSLKTQASKGQGELTLHAGCLTLSSSRGSKPSDGASEWWVNEAIAAGIPPQSWDGCAVLVRAASSVNLTASADSPLVVVSGIDVSVAKTVGITSPGVQLAPAASVQAVLRGGCLHSDDGFVVCAQHPAIGSSVEITTDLPSSTETVLIDCGSMSGPSRAHWVVRNGTSAAGNLGTASWSGKACTGIATSGPNSALPLVALAPLSPAELALELGTFGDEPSSKAITCTMTTTKMTACMPDGSPLMAASWPAGVATPTLSVVGGTADLFLDLDPAGVLTATLPRVVVKTPAAARITGWAHSSVAFPSGGATFSSRTREVTPKQTDSDLEYCLLARDQCSTERFVDYAVLGGEACWTKAESAECRTTVVSTVEFVGPAKCSNDANGTTWSLEINSPEHAEEDNLYPFGFYAVYIYYYLSIFSAVLIWAQPSLRSSIFFSGWLPLFVTASLSEVNDDPFAWDPTVRALVSTCSRAVFSGGWPGWFCDGDLPFPLKLSFYGILAFMILAVLARYLVARDRPLTPLENAVKVLRPAGLGVSAFYVAPIVLAHISSQSFSAAASTRGFILLLAQLVALCALVAFAHQSYVNAAGAEAATGVLTPTIIVVLSVMGRRDIPNLMEVRVTVAILAILARHVPRSVLLVQSALELRRDGEAWIHVGVLGPLLHVVCAGLGIAFVVCVGALPHLVPGPGLVGLFAGWTALSLLLGCLVLVLSGTWRTVLRTLLCRGAYGQNSGMTDDYGGYNSAVFDSTGTKHPSINVPTQRNVVTSDFVAEDDQYDDDAWHDDVPSDAPLLADAPLE